MVQRQWTTEQSNLLNYQIRMKLKWQLTSTINNCSFLDLSFHPIYEVPLFLWFCTRSQFISCFVVIKISSLRFLFDCIKKFVPISPPVDSSWTTTNIKGRFKQQSRQWLKSSMREMKNLTATVGVELVSINTLKIIFFYGIRINWSQLDSSLGTLDGRQLWKRGWQLQNERRFRTWTSSMDGSIKGTGTFNF